MLESLRSLAVFVKTVEHGSFREAARTLSLSPSVVSHHVGELERRLAVPLLYRSTRRIALTPDGERLYAAAREMVDAAKRGLDSVSGRSDTPSGELRMTAPAFFTATSVCRDLAAFSSEHPGVKLKISFNDARDDLIRDGFDLALRVGGLPDSSLKTRKLATMGRRLVGSPQYVHKQEVPRALRDLQRWDFLQLSSRPAEISLTPPGKKAPVALAFAPKLAVDSAAAIRELALAGAGIAGLPEVMVRADLARGHLVEVLPDWRMVQVGVYAVWPDSTQRPTLTLRFIDFLAPRIAAQFSPAGAGV
jgi:DNA-binding transcriptional LysR family regulator